MSREERQQWMDRRIEEQMANALDDEQMMDNPETQVWARRLILERENK